MILWARRNSSSIRPPTSEPTCATARSDTCRDCCTWRPISSTEPAICSEAEAADCTLADDCCEAAAAEATDWPQILALYGALDSITDNPMVELNHAIALAMVDGPRAGLARLDALEAGGRLEGHHRLDAVYAHVLEMAGEERAAIARYRRAAELTANVPERRYLAMRAERLAAGA